MLHGVVIVKNFIRNVQKQSTLKNENLYLAKVDATENKELASKYKIASYPTINYFQMVKQFHVKQEELKKMLLNG